MDFFEKLGSLGKTAGDMVGETIEITRMNTRIASLRRESAEAKTRLGEYYWQHYAEGDVLEEGAGKLCSEISAIEGEIAEIEDEIQKRRSQLEAKPAEPVASEALACGACGKLNSSATKFCVECGARLFTEACTETRFCAACGSPREPGAIFCGNCGAKFTR